MCTGQGSGWVGSGGGCWGGTPPPNATGPVPGLGGLSLFFGGHLTLVMIEDPPLYQPLISGKREVDIDRPSRFR